MNKPKYFMTTRSTESNEAYRGFYPVIAPLVMCSGIGDGKTTACVMAQAATIDALRKGLTLDAPTDQMECACPVLRRMAIYANDAKWWQSDAERTEHLRPLIPLLLDSRVSEATGWKRIWLIVDRVVRDLTPMRLEFIGRKEDQENIKALRSLAPITDRVGAVAARDLCAKFKSDAYASTSASTYAYAYAYASTYADADADADEQKPKYRTAYLQLFRDVASIKD